MLCFLSDMPGRQGSGTTILLRLCQINIKQQHNWRKQANVFVVGMHMKALYNFHAQNREGWMSLVEQVELKQFDFHLLTAQKG